MKKQFARYTVRLTPRAFYTTTGSASVAPETLKAPAMLSVSPVKRSAVEWVTLKPY